MHPLDKRQSSKTKDDSYLGFPLTKEVTNLGSMRQKVSIKYTEGQLHRLVDMLGENDAIESIVYKKKMESNFTSWSEYDLMVLGQ